MSSVVIAGDTSGTVTLSAPAVAGTTTLTLPATTGTILTTTGGVAPGTNGNVLTSNGTTWTSAAPASSGPVLKLVTDSTDITVANIASSYSAIGSTFSVSIPTTGFIRIGSFAGKFQWSSVADNISLNLGLRIGSTNYWLGKVSNNGTISYANIVGSVGGAGYEEYYGAPMRYPVGSTAFSQNIVAMVSDISVLGIPTGTQTVQLIGSYGTVFAGIGILKGTVTTTKVGIEFVSAS